MKLRQLVNLEDIGRWIAQTSEPVSMMTESYFYCQIKIYLLTL